MKPQLQGDDLAALVEHFRHRVLQDALNEATSSYWLRRAEVFEKVGTAECDQVALACRTHAALVPFQTDIDPLVVAAIREVA